MMSAPHDPTQQIGNETDETDGVRSGLGLAMY